MLFKVRLINGRDQWVLCHLEIQTSYEAEFAFRIDSYNAGLKWMFRQEVVTLVILADLKPDWRPTEHRFELGEFESIRRFPVCKLTDRLVTDWSDGTSLVSQRLGSVPRLNWCETSTLRGFQQIEFESYFV